MSDASELKRWETISIDTKIPGTRPDVDGVPRVTVVSATDHDRIMAERDELWKRATKFVMPGEMDTGESIEHYIKTLEQTIAELQAEVERLKDKLEVFRNREYGAENESELKKTIATQARVIEKLSAALEECETLVDTDPITTKNDNEEVESWVNADHLREIVQTALADVAAIEKEGAKDE